VIEQRLEGSGFVFKSAEDLLIMDGDTRLARATYISHAKRNSELKNGFQLECLLNLATVFLTLTKPLH